MSNVIATLAGPRPSITVDGVELNASKVYLSQESGNFPQVVIVLDASQVKIETENTDVTVQTPQADIRKFLLSINPSELEAEVLENTTYADSVMAGALRILIEKADAAGS